MKTKCRLNIKLLQSLSQNCEKYIDNNSFRIPFEVLELSFDDSRIAAVFENGKNSVNVLVLNDGKKILSARLTDIKTKGGLKVYAEYPERAGDYEKSCYSNTLKFVLDVARMLCYAYEHQSEEAPYIFITGIETKSSDEILLVRTFDSSQVEQEERSAKGCRKAPEEPFAVKGHYRHLKSGKIAWVRPHIKGEKHGKK